METAYVPSSSKWEYHRLTYFQTRIENLWRWHTVVYGCFFIIENTSVAFDNPDIIELRSTMILLSPTSMSSKSNASDNDFCVN